MKRLLFAAGVALAACTSMAAPAEPAPPPVSEAPDQCNASQYQSLVGTKITDLPPKPAGAVWRTACTECPVTMDYSPVRMNIFFDKETEVIKQVRCG